MAVLQNIRVKFGLAISIIIALALLSFIIDPSTVESALNSMSSKYDVGMINGKSVSYTDFQEDVQRFTTIHEVTAGNVQGEEAQKQIRDAAWQSLVDKYLFLKNAKGAGLRVGNDEVVAYTSGELVSPVLAQNYAFLNEKGEYDPEALVQLVKNADTDASGSLKAYWNFIQNSVYTQAFYEKYYSLFQASDFQNALSLKNVLAGNNETADVDFVVVPFGYDVDSTVTVTSKEIKDYYNLHKDFFKQQESRDIEYVLFEVVPSEEDINETSESVTEIYEEFAATDNMKKFLASNSEAPLSEYWYKDGELNRVSPVINDFVAANKAGAVSPVDKSGNTFYAVKVMAEANVPDSAYVKHILLSAENESLADSLLAVLKSGKESFSAIAAQYSADQNSAADGELGNIGWMTQTYMIPGFESVITAAKGQPYLVKTQYGQHIVLVSDKTAPVLKKQIALLSKTAIASKETFNNFYAKANKFATLANGSYENYLAAVDTMGVYSHRQNNVLESTESYGAVDNAKEVTRWVFEPKASKVAKKGVVSNIITVNQNYFFIAAVKGVHEEGVATCKEVASVIENKLYADKLGAKKVEDVSAEVEGLTDLQAIADKLGATINTSNDVAFSAFASQRLDPAFVGAVASAETGKICGPVKGANAVYMFQVKNRETGSFYTEEDADTYAAQKVQYMTQMVVPTMMSDADVKDNRARFY